MVIESVYARRDDTNSTRRDVGPPLYETRLELAPKPGSNGVFTGRFEVGNEPLPYYQDLNSTKIMWRIEMELETPSGTYEETLPLRMIPRTVRDLPPPPFEETRS